MSSLIRQLSSFGPPCEPDTQFFTGEYIGLELELENFNEPTLEQHNTLNSYWTLTNDDSLRGRGIEFVFNRPLCNSDISKAISDFQQFKNSFRAPYKLLASLRTSCHVHLNIGDMDEREMSNLILISIMYEPLLYRLVGKSRYFNNNCVPIHNNPEVANIVNSLRQLPLYKQQNRQYQDICNDIIVGADYLGKYCGINISSIFKNDRGSLEFRMCEGTTNTFLIKNWIKTVIRLKELAKNTEFVTELLTFCENGQTSNLTPETLLHLLVKPDSFLYKRAMSFTDHDTLVCDIITGVESAKNVVTLSETGEDCLKNVNTYLKTA